MTPGASERASISPGSAGRCTRRKVPAGSIHEIVALVSAWATFTADGGPGASASGTATRFETGDCVPCRLTPIAM